MQGSSHSTWTPPRGTLGELIDAAQARVQSLTREMPRLREVAASTESPPSFAVALRGEQVRVVAEVKRSSPSRGAIAPSLDAGEQAQRYERGGAAAISVLTEPTRFGGSLEDLERAANAVSIPVLRKDFTVHPAQIWEARAAGAAAVLLIVRALPPDLLAELIATTVEARLDALVEVRDDEELAQALRVGATVVGVNNRDLETLVIDPSTAPRLIPHIPPSIIAIAESGMRVADDAAPAIAAGADALLIGSALSAADDPAEAVAAFATIPRRPR